ncbi:hypothetical protein GCM10009117_02160 [Gangjinia marincola]|uniref:DUF4834 domain-containing protein n=1 Tax=Gangjinia marincola TaxID=578463 RepID=A0ABN1MDB0_9FLAO
MQKLLITLLTFLLIYYAVKFILRLFGPRLMRYGAKKAGEHFERKFRERTQTYTQTKEEGDITVIKKTRKSKYPKTSTKVGEYVDYEEVE